MASAASNLVKFSFKLVLIRWWAKYSGKLCCLVLELSWLSLRWYWACSMLLMIDKGKNFRSVYICRLQLIKIKFNNFSICFVIVNISSFFSMKVATCKKNNISLVFVICCNDKTFSVYPSLDNDPNIVGSKAWRKINKLFQSGWVWEDLDYEYSTTCPTFRRTTK